MIKNVKIKIISRAYVEIKAYKIRGNLVTSHFSHSYIAHPHLSNLLATE